MRRISKLSLFASPAVVAAMALNGGDPPAEPGQRPHVFEKQIMVKLNYLLFLPEDYKKDSEKKWPMILFLHGAGERGSDINKVKIHGPPKIVAHQKDFPFIVVSPQCPEGSWWEPFQLIALLDEIQATYRVDPDRVYLTGLSMGGFGTWDLSIRNPERFAAIAPIYGGGNPVLARRIKDLPIWVFHGDKDGTVPVARSDEMVAALKKAGADMKYTRYEGVDHDSWTRTYDNPELYTWLLSHRRGEKKAGPPPGGSDRRDPPPGRTIVLMARVLSIDLAYTSYSKFGACLIDGVGRPPWRLRFVKPGALGLAGDPQIPPTAPRPSPASPPRRRSTSSSSMARRGGRTPGCPTPPGPATGS